MINKKNLKFIKWLVVVLIMGILAALAVPQYRQALEKSRATDVMHDIRTFKRVISLLRPSRRAKSRKLNGDGSGAGQYNISSSPWFQATRARMNELNNSCSNNFCYDIHVPYVQVHRANSSTYQYTIGYSFANRQYFCHAKTVADLKICNALASRFHKKHPHVTI